MEKLTPNLKDFLFYILLIVGSIVTLTLFFSKEPPKVTTKEESTTSVKKGKQYSSPPPMTINSQKKYFAQVSTNLGKFEIELFPKETANTVNNFVFLAKDGFYNDTPFHRIIKGFMIQGGDPKGDGTGGPGYTFADEKIEKDYQRGIVAMANSGPNTNGSQFFIMHQDYDLPKNYVIFGTVTKGMETIDKIANIEVEENAQGEKSKPKQKATIEKITISEN